MKKSTKILLLVSAIAMIVMVLSACNFIGATSITIVKYPPTTFEVGDTLKTDEIQVSINSGNPISLTTAMGMGVKVKNFNTSKVGSFTAIIEYQGFQATFNYSVVAKENDFASGSGTMLDPYIILTENEFKNICNKSNTYFQLGADLTFDMNARGNYTNACFKGNLDGNGHTINIIGNNSIRCIFGTIENGTIENLIFNHSSQNVMLAKQVYGKTVFRNIDMTGTIKATESNYSPYAQLIGYNLIYNKGVYVDFSMIDCENRANIYHSVANGYMGVFVGYSCYANDEQTKNNKFEFINCVNHGSIEGYGIGLLCGNALQINVENAITIKNLKNEGSIKCVDGFYEISPKGVLKTENIGTIDDNAITNNTITSNVSKITLYNMETVVEIKNNEYIIKPVEDVAKYVIAGYFESYANNDNSGVNNKVYMKSQTYSDKTSKFATGIYDYVVVEYTNDMQLFDTSLGDMIKLNKSNNNYVFINNYNAWKYVKGNTKLILGIYMYDDSNNLIGYCNIK